MRNKRRVSVVIITTIMISIIAFAILVTLFSWQVKGFVWDFSEYFIAIASLIVSIAALIVALVTFLSIDSVNAISSMEGNVLENSNYTMESVYLVREYQEAQNQTEFMKKLMSDLKIFVKKHSSSCMEFADSLQYIIDRLIWFAYVDNSTSQYQKNKEKLLKYIDKKNKKYNKISNGIQYILNENVKLIRYIMEYQQNSTNSNYDSYKIINIRGRMIRNSISRVIYYDYLGLAYRRQAVEEMRKGDRSGWEFSVESMTNIKGNAFSDGEVEKIRLLLSVSENAFKEAEKCSEGDMLWAGYIKFNLARVYTMRYLLGDSEIKSTALLKQLSEVVAVRKQVCLMYNKEEKCYLNEKLEEELKYAKILYENVSEFLNTEEK